jgi:transposase-like protein
MDQALAEFRHVAARENRGRRGLQRRYSPDLQQQAVEYWRRRRQAGDRMRAIAAALGVAEWSLQRWIRASKTRPGFQAVHVITPVPKRPVTTLVIHVTAEGPRIEGLSVESAAQLLRLLR